MLKNLKLMISCALIMGVTSLFAQQDADWPFYIEFEDATGTKDTIWFIFDNNATINADPDLGETPISVGEDFQVYLLVFDGISDLDTFDVFAYPINQAIADIEIFASNYTLPLTLRWDSALFQSSALIDVLGYGVNSARLDNDWIFFNGGSGDQFDMMSTNELVLPFYQYSHFPIFCGIQTGELNTIGTNEEFPLEVNVYPNPVNARLNIQAEQPISEIQIYDLSGRMVMEEKNRKELLTVDVAGLTKGMYTAVVTDIRGNRGVKKFVKM